MAAPHRYDVRIFWSDEDDGYIAVAPTLPGCTAFGADRPEAANQICSAIVAWLEACARAGNIPPEPEPRLVAWPGLRT